MSVKSTEKSNYSNFGLVVIFDTSIYLYCMLEYSVAVLCNEEYIYIQILCYPRLLLSQKHFKNAQDCGCFQGLAQSSHCFGLKWVSVTKAACM